MSSTTQRPSSPTTTKRAGIDPRIFLLSMGMFALGTDAFVIAGVLPTIAGETGVSEGVAGQLVTVFSLTYALGAPFLAALISRLPRNRALLGALMLFGLANVGSALAPTFFLLMLTRVLTGIFAATFAPLAYATATSLAPAEKRGQALSLVLIGLTVATIIGTPLGTWVGEHFGWRFSFVLIAVLATVAFLSLLLVGLPRAEAMPRLSIAARLAPMTQPRLVLALVPAFIWNIGIYMVYTYIAPLLQSNLHIADISGLLILYGLGTTLATLAAGRVVDRFGHNPPLILALVVLILAQFALPWATTSLLGTLPILLVLGMGAGIAFTPQQHRMLTLAPEHLNVILALNNSIFYLGIASGSALGGWALRGISVIHLPWLGAACLLLSLIPFAFSIRSVRNMPVRVSDRQEKVPVIPE